ncbi:hypothetical protein AB4874_17730 [Thioclava sp. 15-R06ZXC-3]|uniref:Uncharacterized protein n=1 Tax=Thioclava arctica TaxID=3238301 RepID=A0ABV3TPK9_9RHOB
MGIALQDTCLHHAPVPAAQINETRRAFPGARFLYELDFEADDPLQGVAICATGLRGAGLKLNLLRCTAGGVISLRVEDQGEGDLHALTHWLAAQDTVKLRHWVTVLT